MTLTLKWWSAIVAALILLATGTNATAQSGSSAQSSAASSNLVPMKVNVVITRNKDEKVISSLPFTLWVNANEPAGASVRMGMSVPIPSGPARQVSYRNIGTNIDCVATAMPGGLFELHLTIDDSSVYDQSSSTAAGSVTMSGYPAFRSFTSSVRVITHDGQTIEYTMATDKLTGEVLKVAVTATVVK